MVVGRCLTGALAVSGALALGGCTISLGLSSELPHRAGADASGVVGGRADGHRASRVVPSGMSAQLIASGRAVGDMLAAEGVDRHPRSGRLRRGQRLLVPGSGASRSLAARRVSDRRLELRARHLAQRIRTGHPRWHRRVGLGRQRRH